MSRIHPMVCSSTPLTVTFTAQIRTAPASTSTILTPIPIFRGSFRFCRENAEAGCLDTAVQELEERRAYLCRLTPDRALESPEETLGFLRDRGLLTRTPDCALPSFFGACHEEPYTPGSSGFGSWPATKYPWYFQLAERPDVHELRVHRGKSILFTDATLPLVDGICRSELARMEQQGESARLLRHLADAGPSTLDDLQTELALKPKELKLLRYPLELCAVHSSAVACESSCRTAVTPTRASSSATTRPT